MCNSSFQKEMEVSGAERNLEIRAGSFGVYRLNPEVRNEPPPAPHNPHPGPPTPCPAALAVSCRPVHMGTRTHAWTHTHTCINTQTHMHPHGDEAGAGGFCSTPGHGAVGRARPRLGTAPALLGVQPGAGPRRYRTRPAFSHPHGQAQPGAVFPAGALSAVRRLL